MSGYGEYLRQLLRPLRVYELDGTVNGGEPVSYTHLGLYCERREPDLSMTTHERPGVYSDYDASTVVSSTGGGQTAGLVAVCTEGEAGTLYVLNRYEDAVTTFGQEENLTELVHLLLLNGCLLYTSFAASIVGEHDGSIWMGLCVERDRF